MYRKLGSDSFDKGLEAENVISELNSMMLDSFYHKTCFNGSKLIIPLRGKIDVMTKKQNVA